MSVRMKHLLPGFLLLTCLLHSASSISSRVAFAYTNRYMEQRSIVFDAGTYIGTNQTTLNPKIFTSPLANTQNSLNYQVAVSISHITYVIPPSMVLNYSLAVGNKASSNVQILLYTSNANNITLLSINTLVFTPGILSMDVVYQRLTVQAYFSPNQTISKVQPLGTVMDIDRLYQSIIGVDATASDNSLSIGFSTEFHMINQTELKIIVTSLSNKTTYLNKIHLMVFLCPSPALMPDSLIIYMSLVNHYASLPSHGDLMFRYYNDWTNNFNVFSGINTFLIKNGPNYNYNIYINPSVSVDFYGESNLERFSFYTVVLNYYKCHSPTPYLHMSSKTCYDICPDYYYTNKATLQCDLCPSNCRYCKLNSSALVCAPCQTGYDLFNGTCSPICGDGLSVGDEKCDSGGLLGLGCSSTCTVQRFYYCYIQGATSTCAYCPPNCQTCSNSMYCLTCSPGFSLAISNSKCSFPCNITLDCSSCANSLIVNGTATTPYCITCKLGYQMLAGNTLCTPICSDGIFAPPEQCDIGNISGYGCSYCQVIAGYYCKGTYPNISTCSACQAHCSTCNDSNLCTSCQSNYQFYNYSGGSVACVLKCNAIYQCTSCRIVNLTTLCQTCNTGFYLTATRNTCTSRCGDGIRVSPQGCDDENTANGDGCDSSCSIESKYYCSTVYAARSTCGRCMDFCDNCTSANSCSLCQTNYIFFNSACTRNCSFISKCNQCNATQPSQCLDCQIAYYVTNQVCVPRCGDGMVAIQEGCDDGNTVSGDGCSFNCTLQYQYYYCQNSTLYSGVTSFKRTMCARCIPNCRDCYANQYNCTTCQAGYAGRYLYGSYSCAFICTSYSNCDICNPQGCETCSPGYMILSGGNCGPICGDGIIAYPETCDDGNSYDGDGCNSRCRIQDGFTCSGSQRSVCSLVYGSIKHAATRKDPRSNTATLTYQIYPISPQFNNLNWLGVVTPIYSSGPSRMAKPVKLTSGSYRIFGITYDSATGLLNVILEYYQNLNYQQVDLKFNFPTTPPFNNMPTVNIPSSPLVSNNNLSLDVYSSQQYEMAIVIENLALTMSIIALILFALGYYKGKIVTLECITVFQLAFYSLITVENVSPTFSALTYLGFSCGYSVKSLQAIQTALDRQFVSLNYRESFFQNFNLVLALIFLPLIVSFVLWIVNKRKYQSHNQRLTKWMELLRGQWSLYGVLFSAYTIIIATGIQIKLAHSAVGITFGILLTLMIVVYLVLIFLKPQFFGVFTENFFRDSILQHKFYCLIILERVLTATCLLMIFFKPQGALILPIIGAQMLVVLYKRPYAGVRGNVRPFLNLVVSSLIQLIYIMGQSLSSNQQYSIYAPVVIVALLALTLTFSIYYYIKEFGFCQPLKEMAMVDQAQDVEVMKQEAENVERYGTVINNAKIALLEESKALKENFVSNKPKLNFSDVRDRLIKTKIRLAVENLDKPEQQTFHSFQWDDPDAL